MAGPLIHEIQSSLGFLPRENSTPIEPLPDFLIKKRIAEARQNQTLADTLDGLKRTPAITLKEREGDFFGMRMADAFTDEKHALLGQGAYWCDPCKGWVRGWPLEYQHKEGLGMEHAEGTDYHCNVCHTQIGEFKGARS